MPNSSYMTCGTCCYHRHGDCRRYPPKRVEVQHRDAKGWVTETEIVAEHPETPDDHWCGEWKQKYLVMTKEQIEALNA